MHGVATSDYAHPSALEKALRDLIKARDRFGWSPEVDECFGAARAALGEG